MLTDLTSMDADLQERVLCYMKMADEAMARMVKMESARESNRKRQRRE
jgi:hypothetical protein